MATVRSISPDVQEGARSGVPRVTVLAPAPTVNVELATDPTGADTPGNAEVHLHPGGQGAWVAGMVVALGAEVSMCAPLGGELGGTLAQMLRSANISVKDIGTGVATGAQVVDLRGEERQELATMVPAPLGRHELDDFYGMALVDALESDVLIVTGVNPPELVPASFFARLVADVRAAGRTVVADLSGEAAEAVIPERPSVLKMSHEEVLAGGLAASESLGDLLVGARRIVTDGVEGLVMSRAADPALLVTAEGAWLVTGPSVRAVQPAGAGDSMTAGIAVGLARGLGIVDAVRLGTAAGALNVARRGLGSGRREQIERLAAQVTVERVEEPRGEVA